LTTVLAAMVAGMYFFNKSLTSYLAEWVQYFTVDSPLLCLLQWLLGMTELFYVPMQRTNWHHMLDEMTEWFFQLCRPHVMCLGTAWFIISNCCIFLFWKLLYEFDFVYEYSWCRAWKSVFEEAVVMEVCSTAY
jgi:hypothetical protein